jgi:hypothetical protein
VPRRRRLDLCPPLERNPDSGSDRERRCAEKIRIAIVPLGDGIAQPMRSSVGDRSSFVRDLCHGVAGGITGIVQHSGCPVSHRCSLVRDLRSGLPDRFASLYTPLLYFLLCGIDTCGKARTACIISVPRFGIFVVEAHIGL